MDDFIRIEKYEPMIIFMVEDRNGNTGLCRGPKRQLDRYLEANGYTLLGEPMDTFGDDEDDDA